ncbi:hypothetical protein [Asticcacaulis solisilvae]|uniref:hypothetical protein n=1 Tax=Asticcacaulis solisilvae TaxID=1217274 RepID=UPI003FD7BA34
MTNVVYLHKPDPIAQFLRVGHSAHRSLEHLLLTGNLPYSNFVIDAGVYSKQLEFISMLKKVGREVILDTNIAELSAVGKYQGAAKGAPWANGERILTESDLRPGANDHIIGEIAKFAVENGVDRVLAPAHFLVGATDAWFNIDIAACSRLRSALDIEGGKSIAIDYPLIISNKILNDESQRRVIISALQSVPLNSLWVRVSGFGSDATPVGIRKYISAVQNFHALKMPVVADFLGGMSGLAALSFGAVCGIAHGVAEKERFDATAWSKPPTPKDPEKKQGGINSYHMLLPGIDRLLKAEQAKALVDCPSGRRLLSCNNRSCCPRGFEDTLSDPKRHYLRQRAFQCEAISDVPELKRAEHFLNDNLANADRVARNLTKLKPTDPVLSGLLEKNAKRLDGMRFVLEDLIKTEGQGSRSPAFSKAHINNVSSIFGG